MILLDAGDTYQGGIESNLSEGALVVDAYNALGYTAAALGNHDFEYGAVDAWDDATPRDDDPRGALKAEGRTGAGSRSWPRTCSIPPPGSRWRGPTCGRRR